MNIVLDVPRLEEAGPGYCPTRIESSLDESTGRVLLAIFRHGRRNSLRLKSGRFVDTYPKALRWLLEQCADGMGGEGVRVLDETDQGGDP